MVMQRCIHTLGKKWPLLPRVHERQTWCWKRQPRRNDDSQLLEVLLGVLYCVIMYQSTVIDIDWIACRPWAPTTKHPDVLAHIIKWCIIQINQDHRSPFLSATVAMDRIALHPGTFWANTSNEDRCNFCTQLAIARLQTEPSGCADLWIDLSRRTARREMREESESEWAFIIIYIYIYISNAFSCRISCRNPRTCWPNGRFPMAKVNYAPTQLEWMSDGIWFLTKKWSSKTHALGTQDPPMNTTQPRHAQTLWSTLQDHSQAFSEAEMPSESMHSVTTTKASLHPGAVYSVWVCPPDYSGLNLKWRSPLRQHHVPWS